MNALGYLPLTQEKRHTSWLRIPFGKLAWITVSLPFFSFIFCVIWSVLFNFEKATFTHCKVCQHSLTLFLFFLLPNLLQTFYDFFLYRWTTTYPLSQLLLATLVLSEMCGGLPLALMHCHGFLWPLNITAITKLFFINGLTHWLLWHAG